MKPGSAKIVRQTRSPGTLSPGREPGTFWSSDLGFSLSLCVDSYLFGECGKHVHVGGCMLSPLCLDLVAGPNPGPEVERQTG